MSFRIIGIVAIALLGVVFVMSSDAKDKVSDDGLTVSHDASNDPPFEWTLEKMLLATPMPMTEEGRKFLSSHPSLDGIRTWSDAQFDKYLDSDYAKQHVAEEAWRWRDIASMLETQVIRGSQFLGKPSPLPPAKPTAYDWKKLSIEDMRKLVDGKDRKIIFEQMKTWRKEIADLAPQVEAIRKEAESKGLSEKLEQVMTPDQ
jgi:hypothetical protein